MAVGRDDDGDSGLVVLDGATGVVPWHHNGAPDVLYADEVAFMILASGVVECDGSNNTTL